MKCRCLDTLTAEHHTMLRITDVLDAMSKAAADACEYNAQDVNAILEILRRFGDELHQAKEERALFPVFIARSDASEYAAVRHMMFEHQQDRSLMSGMADAISRSNAPQFSEYAARLVSMLRNHIFKEDNILFEVIQTHLSAEDDARIVRDFEAFDQDFQDRYKNLMHDLRQLEWKYLRKIA